MTRRLPGWKADTDAIRSVLMSEWNPIGVDVPDDEYDSYIPLIYRMIQEHKSVDQLSLALSDIESERMGLQANQQRNRRVADLLLKVVQSNPRLE
jgi:hypothetical protein